MSNSKIGKISVYAAGGAGINVCQHFTPFIGKQEEGFASIDITYIDTSRSNMNKNIGLENTYILEGLDGSGKVRAENHKQIAECVLDILQTHKPEDLSIVVSSTSGGSGSVIAPSLVSELLSRGKSVIVMMIGSNDSRIELENTIKTMKSYENISKMRKQPIAAMYFENSKSTPRAQVDKQIQVSIVMLSALFSRQNKELDSADLVNWLNYTKVTSYQPHLVMLEFFSSVIEVQKPAVVISVATLSVDGAETSPGSIVEYQCVGYMPEEAMKKIDTPHPIHAVLLDGVFNDTHKRLDKMLGELDEARNARIVRSTILSDNDHPTEVGLVL